MHRSRNSISLVVVLIVGCSAPPGDDGVATTTAAEVLGQQSTESVVHQRCLHMCEDMQPLACPAQDSVRDCYYGCRLGTLTTPCAAKWQSFINCAYNKTSQFDCDVVSGSPVFVPCQSRHTAYVNCVGPNPL